MLSIFLATLSVGESLSQVLSHAIVLAIRVIGPEVLGDSNSAHNAGVSRTSLLGCVATTGARRTEDIVIIIVVDSVAVR